MAPPSTSSTSRSRSRRDTAEQHSAFQAHSSVHAQGAFQPFPSGPSSSWPSSPFPHSSSRSPSLPSQPLPPPSYARDSYLRARVSSAAEQRRTPSASAASYASHGGRSHRSHRDRDKEREKDRESSRRGGGTAGGDTASESGMSVLSAFGGGGYGAHETEQQRRERKAARRARREARKAAEDQGGGEGNAKEKKEDLTDSVLRRWWKWVTEQPLLRPWSVWLMVAMVVGVKWVVGLGGYSGLATPPLRGDFEAQRHWLALTSSSLSTTPRVPFLPFLKLYNPPSFTSSSSSTNSTSIFTSTSTPVALPPSEWYFTSPQYWALDYPPLTAYHSFLLGFLARLTPSTARYMLLHPSTSLPRGVSPPPEQLEAWEKEMSRLEEGGGMKDWMRASVVVGDVVVWVSAVLVFCKRNYAKGGKEGKEGEEGKAVRRMLVAASTILLHPGLILIDNGHFQYNSLMLGLTLHALNAFQAGHDLLGAVLFVLSLGFKQMALYFSPGVFAYLLGKCVWLGGRKGLTLFLHLGLTVLLTFSLLLSPLFLSSSSPAYPSHGLLSTLLQTLHRIFPFQRGLFEDKVANVWCALNVVVKLRTLASIPTLTRLALVATATAVAPVVGGTVWLSRRLYLRRISSTSSSSSSSTASSTAPEGPAPTAVLLPHLLLLSSLSFFLLSFQVHEKSILLPLMPLLLLMGGRECGWGREDWEWGCLVGNVAVFSMWPLLKRDGVAVQYLALTALWNFVVGYNPLRVLRKGSFVKAFSLLTYSTLLLLHLLELLTPPPPHLPDLFVVANVSVSCGVFALAWLWAARRGVMEGWALL
ncbi:hypothetical protein JCM8547_007674 [Rhodosporidiobolus lusitaniae]